MGYTEKFNLDGKYDWRIMELTEEEVKQVTDEHREISKRIMEECIKDGWDISKNILFGKNPQLVGDMVVMRPKVEETAVALFEARCPKLYTMIQNKLMEKIKKVVPKQFFEYEVYLKTKEEKLRED